MGEGEIVRHADRWLTKPHIFISCSLPGLF